MFTPVRSGEGFFELQKEDGEEKCAPPRSGLVQPPLRRRLFCRGMSRMQPVRQRVADDV